MRAVDSFEPLSCKTLYGLCKSLKPGHDGLQTSGDLHRIRMPYVITKELVNWLADLQGCRSNVPKVESYNYGLDTFCW